MLTIPFPAIDPVALEIGPIAIRWYALAYLAGFILGWRHAAGLARRRGGVPPAEDLDDFLTWAVMGVILGGRLGFVLFYNFPHYAAHPAEIVKIWQGGMSFHGGLLGMVVVMLTFAWRRGYSPLALSDVVAGAVPIGLFFGRIANFINGELYGRVTETVPWAMVFPDGGPLPRHPSQLYQAGLEGLLLFVILFACARVPAINARTGTLTGIFLVGYGIVRIIGELFRQPDPQLGFLIGGATMGQLLSVPMVLAGLGLILWAGRTRPAPARDAATPNS